MFAVELRSEANRAERRGERRTMVDIAGRLTTTDSWRAVCRVSDLSSTGARLKTYDALEAGGTVWLRLPHTEQRAATIVWTTEAAAGCAFHDPLTDNELGALVAMYGFTPGSGATDRPGAGTLHASRSDRLS